MQVREEDDGAVSMLLQLENILDAAGRTISGSWTIGADMMRDAVLQTNFDWGQSVMIRAS